MTYNWDEIDSKFKRIIEGANFRNGKQYRAVTAEGDIYNGIMTYHCASKVELQIKNDFKSFNRCNTKIVLISKHLLSQ